MNLDLIVLTFSGAFLVPYFITVFLVGIPCFAIEVFVGQFQGTGGFGAWAINPLFQGKVA